MLNGRDVFDKCVYRNYCPSEHILQTNGLEESQVGKIQKYFIRFRDGEMAQPLKVRLTTKTKDLKK